MSASASAALAAAVWPAERLGDVIEQLARRSGLGAPASSAWAPPPADPAERTRWLHWAAGQAGLQAVSVDAPLPDLPAMLGAAGPALLPLPGGDCLALLGRRGGRLLLLGPDLRPVRMAAATVADALSAGEDAALQPDVDRLLELAAVPAPQRPRVAAALRRERLAAVRSGPCWLLRAPPGTGFARQLVQAGLPAQGLALVAVFALLYALEIVGWGLIGQAALGGRLDAGWLWAWGLAVLSLVPLRVAGQALQSSLALDAGRLLKTRLMAGALRLDIDRVRELGVGQWLGRVLESQALEGLALSGGLGAAVALLELGFAALVLSQGAVPAWHLGLLLAWVGLTAVLGLCHAQRLRAWVGQRLDLTHALVETMVGHRTRLAQDRAAQREAAEDRALQASLAAATAMDRIAPPVRVGLPAGWAVLAVLALAPALTTATAVAPLAISLGGILLAQRAFGGLAGGLGGLARAHVAWQQVRDLFAAGASEPQPPARPFVPALGRPAVAATGPARAPLVDAAGLVFGHRPETPPVLAGVDLRIGHGERILLEGASGAGKSTLAALLTGLRTPQAGLLLLAGWDRPTLGDDWHRLATTVPQFHDNHLLSATLAFNLLMGREWPPSLADLAEAEALCHELGLGELLARMPSGLQQRVGETGWQLSHGERSRIFLARALLQRTPLTVVDESFAALDPQTLALCLRCTLARTDALVVIAHP